MGLGGGRKRVKISNDPNNTSWSRATDSFGHRMLLGQGWQPGSTLGARNADYSKHLTAASHSHIRVALREDNLGLGAKRGSGQEAGECVGLDAFQAMLGRLNGKSEEVLAKEASSREDLKRQRYVERKGLINFVYGGRLVGDEYDDKDEEDEDGRDGDGGSDAGRSDDTQTEPARDTEISQTKTKSKTSKKAWRAEKRKHLSDAEDGSDTARDNVAKEINGEEDAKLRKARRKQEKAEKRERKRLKKEAKEAKKSLQASEDILGEPARTVKAEVREVLTIEADPKTSASANATNGRHMSVRSRYIAAKRRAVMDPQALKEILMVKV